MPVPAEKVKFSVLILSILSRSQSLFQLVEKLQYQAVTSGQQDSLEILVLLDNKSKSIAEKRNDLLAVARGRYVAFLDDDDRVSDDYVVEILQAIDLHTDVDCISFNQWCSINGESMNVSFGIGNPHGQLWRTPSGQLGDIKRPPYHMCIWRRQIAQSEAFRSVYTGSGQSSEDIDWLMRLYPKVHTEHHINAVLHKYLYDVRHTASVVTSEMS
jgi:glycosyltransferase involved in cell wall biosynthesis